MIGTDTTVTVLGVKGNQVRLGVVAPKEVAVHREEIWERIRAEELAACKTCKGTANLLCDRHKRYLDKRRE